MSAEQVLSCIDTVWYNRGRCANPYFIFIGIFITVKYWWEFKFVKAEVENKTNVKFTVSIVSN